jgi:GTP-binding protein LepA
VSALRAGEVGFIISGIKELNAAKVGDTITPADRPLPNLCPASRKSSRRFLPDSIRSKPTSTIRCASRWKSSSSTMPRCTMSRKFLRRLGFGFRCGFLGLLHMEIVQERLEREFDQDLITTAPTVVYRGFMRDGSVIQVENPSKLPDLKG